MTRLLTRSGRVLDLWVAGRVVTTTHEHPFWVAGKGWVTANALRVGDEFLTSDGRTATLERVVDDERYVSVYNLEVEADHTYFVGDAGWGFDLWSHNHTQVKRSQIDQLLSGKDVRVNSITKADALLKAALPNAKKIEGTGPGKSGKPDWDKWKGTNENGKYRKDYQVNPETGRIYGHPEGNPHANQKHINVKLPDGTKVTIMIDPK